MAWYFDVGENCCYEEYKVEAWRWWKNGIISFDKWAKEHNIHCEHKQDEDFGEGFDEIIFYDHYADTCNDENVIFKAMDEDLVLIYNPRAEEDGCFPFDVESIEDFHKNYLWYEGFDEEWEWGEEGFKNFSLWAKEHDIQFSRAAWDKEKYGDLLKFPIYTDRHNIVIQLILRPGDILHYSYDKRANGEFPFSIGGEQ